MPPPSPKADPGVVSVASFGIYPNSDPTIQSGGGQGDAIQDAIDAVTSNPKYHTLVFPAGTYLTHDLHIINHTSTSSNTGGDKKEVEIYFEEGVLLQRDGSHIGQFTSPGFFTIFNSSGVTLRGLATFDALNGGQGVYISSSTGVTVDGIIMRNTWWWNTEVEHSHHVAFKNYKIPNDPLFPQAQNDGQ